MIEADAAILAERIRQDFPGPRPLRHPIWRQSPAAKVIDCVLSLRKNYDKVVAPRVQRFVERYSDTVTCFDLRRFMDRFESPEVFVAEVLDMRSTRKAEMLTGVVDYLIDIQSRFNATDEGDRLAAWAMWARPGDFLAVEVRGFKLAGFQYLRMLFGADTVKPDVHILRYVEEVLGRPVSAARAVYVLERAGQLLGKPIRPIDVAIWERGAGRTLPS